MRMTKLITTLALGAMLTVTPISTYAAGVASWGLDRIDQRALPLDSSYRQSLTGRGVSFYAVDTGIYAAHSEFGGRVTDGYTRVSDGLGTGDCHGHGTHTAGTVAGNTTGVAPGVAIIPVRVYGCSGSGWTTDLSAGIRWAIEHHQPGVPAVMNISTSGPLSNSLNWAVRDAVLDGIVVVVAAGNNGRDACSYSPGAAPEAITVGGTESNDTRMSISNFGPCVDIFAPGAWITSAAHTGPNDYRSFKGTSFAAPHVTGIAALILEANPSYTPQQVTDAIKANATAGALVSLDATSPNLLAHVSTAPLAPPGAPATTTTAAPAASTTTAATTTTTAPTATTTTVAPVAQVTARRAGRGNYQVLVNGAQPGSTFAVRATSNSARPLPNRLWLVTADAQGKVMFFIKLDLSRYTMSIVK